MDAPPALGALRACYTGPMICPNCGLAGAIRRRTVVHCSNPGCASYDPDYIPKGSAEDRELTQAELLLAPPWWLRAMVAIVFFLPAVAILAATLTLPRFSIGQKAAAACLVAGTGAFVFMPWFRFKRIKRSEEKAGRKAVRDEAATAAILFGIVGIFAGSFLVFGLRLAGLRDPWLGNLQWLVPLAAAGWAARRAARNAGGEDDDRDD